MSLLQDIRRSWNAAPRFAHFADSPCRAWRERCFCPYLNMAALDPTGGKSKQKKKSAVSKRSHRAGRTRKAKAPSGNKLGPKEPSAIAVGRMERTRRLLLAALRVWELKRRPTD